MFYRCDCRWTYAGQSMQNTLYYRDRDPFSGDLIDQCELLGSKLNLHFFPNTLSQWAAMGADDQVFNTWAIMPYTDVGFDEALAGPVFVQINKPGTGGVDHLPPANSVTMSFLLRNAAVTSGFYQPKRSYIAIGPVDEGRVDRGGFLTSVGISDYQTLANIFAANVGTLAGAGGWAPVRYGEKGNPIVIKGFAEVDGCSPRPVVSYRRSRMPG